MADNEGFTSTGFAPFPDCYHDNLRVGSFTDMDYGVLERMAMEYGSFLSRNDLMPRAKYAGERVMNHLLFEMACQDGIYDDTRRLEDEDCGAA